MNVFIEKYILTSGFLAFLKLEVLGKVLISMFAWLVQITSGPDSQSKFQMCTLFTSRHIGVPWKNTHMVARGVFDVSLGGEVRPGPAPYILTLFKTNITEFPTLLKTEFRFLIPCLRHAVTSCVAFLMCNQWNLARLVSMPKSREVNIK